MIKKKPLNSITKLITTLIFSLIFSTAYNFYILITGLVLILLIIVLIKKTSAFLKYLKIIIPMILFFATITLIFENHKIAFFSSLRLLDIILSFFIFFSTTEIEDITDIIGKAGFSYYISFILIAGFNFVAIVSSRIKNIFDALRARGINLDNKIMILFKIRYFFPPFLIQSFRLAEELAESIETRGFGLTEKKFRKINKFYFFDFILIIFSLILLIFHLYFLIFKKPTLL